MLVKDLSQRSIMEIEEDLSRLNFQLEEATRKETLKEFHSKLVDCSLLIDKILLFCKHELECKEE